MGREQFWLCYGEYRGKRNLKLFYKYAAARIVKESRAAAYAIYVTDSLRAFTRAETRYYDMAYQNNKNVPEQKENGEEIALNIITKYGLKMKEGE